MKGRPLSCSIEDTEGKMYYGFKGFTILLVLKSLFLGLAPSMSPTNKEFDCLMTLLVRNGTGST